MWVKVVITFAVFSYVTACRDNYLFSHSCPEWKKMGRCTSHGHGTSVSALCKKTCGVCAPQGGQGRPRPTGGRQINGPNPASACRDNYLFSYYCPEWKKMGRCTTHRQGTSVSAICKKTCGFCAPKGGQVRQRPTGGRQIYGPNRASGGQGGCGLTAGRMSRIIGGQNAVPNYWKWQVVLVDNGAFFCGGSLIARRWVLTAAHCVIEKIYRRRFLKVVLGEHDRRKREGAEVAMDVERIIIHRSYDHRTLLNDIALIKLKGSAPLNDKIGLVCLPRAGEQVRVGKKCYISGWGQTKSQPTASILQQAGMPIVDQRTCQRKNRGRPIPRSQVCAGYGPHSVTSGCYGDSGGPLVCENENYRYVLQGAVSWGGRNCDSRDMYSVFTRISYYANWINGYLRQ